MPRPNAGQHGDKISGADAEAGALPCTKAAGSWVAAADFKINKKYL